MEPVGEFTPCFLRVVARFSAHADPSTLTNGMLNFYLEGSVSRLNHGQRDRIFQSCMIHMIEKNQSRDLPIIT
jgi:hypothetical protein